MQKAVSMVRFFVMLYPRAMTKKHIGWMIGLVGLLTSIGLTFSVAAARVGMISAPEVIPGQFIVVFKDAAANPDQIETRLAARMQGARIASYRSAINGFAAQLSEEDRATLAVDPDVAYVAEDRIVSSSEIREERVRERLSIAGHTSNTGPLPPAQVLPSGVNRINAENKINTGAGVHVAVVDSGILLGHPDLKNNIVGGKSCVSSSGGFTDQNGHGSHVAGVIAAINNTQGVVGVAPGAKLWSIRVLDRNGYGSYSSIICGLDFIVTKSPQFGGPIKVANISLGGGGTNDNNCGNTNNDPLHKAICRVRDAGVTIVAAAGNSGANANDYVPAAYDDAVISVSALVDSDGALGGLGSSSTYGADDTFATFSNFGTSVDLGAPGYNINSTWLSNTYRSVSGTSMASPHVAGAAALYIATHPSALWEEVKNALITGGEAAGSGHYNGNGLHPEAVVRADAL